MPEQLRARAARARGSWPDSWVDPLVREALFAGIGRSWNAAYRDSARGLVGVKNGVVGTVFSSEIQRPAIEVDGSAADDYVDFTAAETTHLRTDLVSVSCWASRAGAGTNDAMVMSMDDGGSFRNWQFAFRVGSGGPRFLVFGSGGSNGNAQGPTTLNDNQWYHLAGTHDGSTIRMYVDGVEVDNTAFADTLSTDASGLDIGRLGAGSHAINGNVADAMIWGRVLSPGEIRKISRKTWQPIKPRPIVVLVPTGVTAALTGTVTASIDEDDITAGGKTIILTLTGDTWVSGT